MASRAIIVADDDDLFRTRFARFVRANGFVAREARDGTEAMRLLDRRDAEAILLDLVMPGELDGLEVLRRLRRERRLSELRVVVHTAYDGPAAEAARAIGASSIVRKPASPPVLLHRLVGDLSQELPPPAVFVVVARDDVRSRVVEGLRAWGLVPFAFPSVPDALGALRGALPSAVVTDAGADGGVGPDLLPAIRGLEKRVPVVAIGGIHEHEVLGRLADRVVESQVEPGSLAALIRDLAADDG